MDLLNDEFLLCLRCALLNSLRYMLISGYAVNYYWYNRNTIDMDLWIAPTTRINYYLSIPCFVWNILKERLIGYIRKILHSHLWIVLVQKAVILTPSQLFIIQFLTLRLKKIKYIRHFTRPVYEPGSLPIPKGYKTSFTQR